MEEIREAVIEIVAEHMCVAKDTVTADKNLHLDLGTDSLDAVEIAMELEDRFDMNLNDDELAKCVTVGDLVTLVHDTQ